MKIFHEDNQQKRKLLKGMGKIKNTRPYGGNIYFFKLM